MLQMAAGFTFAACFRLFFKSQIEQYQWLARDLSRLRARKPAVARDAAKRLGSFALTGNLPVPYW